jgi:hypothetical protein
MAAAAQKSAGIQHRLGPYSRRLQRGAIGDSVDGRSTLGRLMRHLEAELVAHCGGSPSITHKMLIERAVKIRVQLDLLDEKLTSGGWTPHDARTYGGLGNAYRLTVRELGMKPAAVKAMDAVEYGRLFDARRRAEEAAA